MRCGASPVGLPGLECELESGHEGHHQVGGSFWSDLGDRPPGEQHEEVRVGDEEIDEPEQLAMFEGEPVHRLQVGLGGAGAIAVEKEIRLGDEGTITLPWRCVKVVVHKGAKVTTRKATVRVDAEAVELEVG